MSCSTSVTSLAPSSTAQLVRRVRGATPRVVARDATTAETAALFEALCQDAGVPYQKFVNRTDLACGSTIGPLSAARLGVRTVDVGNPMLAMHSIRETAGAEDPESP